MNQAYIYDPKKIGEILINYPNLLEKLKNISKEEQPCISYPSCMKSKREILRVLSNEHYLHIKQFLSTLEFCLLNGYTPTKLLRTRDKQEFESFSSSLFIAKHFIQQGFHVKALDNKKGSNKTPDILIQKGNLSMSIEMYCPRDWEGVDGFMEELRLGILHLDIPWDFRSSIHMDLIKRFNDNGELLWFDPWKFSEYYAKPHNRRENIENILNRIEQKLSANELPFIVSHLDHDNNVIVEVDVKYSIQSKGPFPERKIVYHYPTFTGYRPEDMFEQLVKGRIKNKIKKGQAQSFSGANLCALFVDVSKLGFGCTEFSFPYYTQKFESSLRKHFDPEKLDVDVILFYWIDSARKISAPMLFKNNKVANAEFEKYFPVKAC